MPQDKSYVALSLGVDLVVSLMKHGLEIQNLIQQAQREGRDHFTLDEWGAVLREADTAETRLTSAIAQAKARGQ